MHFMWKKNKERNQRVRKMQDIKSSQNEIEAEDDIIDRYTFDDGTSIVLSYMNDEEMREVDEIISQEYAEVYGRYCYFCDFDIVHAHHIIPLSYGGVNRDDNKIYLCPNHHYMIHSRKYLLEYRCRDGWWILRKKGDENFRVEPSDKFKMFSLPFPKSSLDNSIMKGIMRVEE